PFHDNFRNRPGWKCNHRRARGGGFSVFFHIQTQPTKNVRISIASTVHIDRNAKAVKRSKIVRLITSGDSDSFGIVAMPSGTASSQVDVGVMRPWSRTRSLSGSLNLSVSSQSGWREDTTGM